MLPLLTTAGAAPAVPLMGVFAVAAAVVLRLGPRTRGRSLEELSTDPTAETATAESGYMQINVGNGEGPTAGK